MIDAADPESERTDGELLARHLAGEASAFAGLVRRHGPLVRTACARALGASEAEDAAQAVFLILARKARRLAGATSLAGWLHRTVRMVCGTALRSRARRKLHEQEAAAMREVKGPSEPAVSAAERAEILARLDAAVGDLPTRHREVVALCYLEGLSQSQAAGRLRMPLGTVAVYARRGLEGLRLRLAGRGRAMPAAVLGALLLSESAGAAGAVSPAFVSSVVSAAGGAAVGAKVLGLAEGGLKAMFWMKAKMVAATLLCAATVVGGGGAVAVKLAAAEPAPAEKRLNPELLKLPENTWVHIKPNRNPVGRSYSGLCYGGGLLFYFGGGHGSHPSNDVELYDVAANTWTQATEPEDWQQADKWAHLTPEQAKAAKQCIGGGSTSTAVSPKNRPLVHHTYQMHAWFPEEKAFYNLVRSHLWAFYPEKREWKRISETAPAGLDVHTWGLRYDPDLKTLLAIVAAGPARGVYLYDAKANTWAKKCDTPAADWSEVHAAYDSVRKLYVVRANKRWWTLDPAAWQTKVIANLPGSGESLSLDYDPASRSALAIIKPKGGCELWAYDADKDAWTQVTMAGEAPKGLAQWGLLDYDPEHKCHLFLNLLNVGGGFVGGRTDGLFAFRLKPAAK